VTRPAKDKCQKSVVILKDLRQLDQLVGLVRIENARESF